MFVQILKPISDEVNLIADGRFMDEKPLFAFQISSTSSGRRSRSLRGRRTEIGREWMEDRACHELTEPIFQNRAC